MEYGIYTYIYIWGSLGNIFPYSLLSASKMKVGSFIETFPRELDFFCRWVPRYGAAKGLSTWHDAPDLPT